MVQFIALKSQIKSTLWDNYCASYTLCRYPLVQRSVYIRFTEKADAEPKRFMLPFEEELGTHPDFEKMRINVAKEHNRPQIPINMRQTEATRLLRETIEECWDSDAEARLTALCVAERFKDIQALMEHKGPRNLNVFYHILT